MKAALLALSLLIPAPVAPANVSPMVVISPAAVVQVICFSKDYISAGTAFRIGGDGLTLSVNHVTGSGQCYINGKPLNLSYKSPSLDFSEVLTGEGPYLQIDCGGFVKGHRYLSLGYARGEKDLVSVELEGTGQFLDGYAILVGMVPIIPGMSGGPILDLDTGKVVGLNNRENFEAGLSWSQELKSTPLCKRNIA